MMKLPKDSEDPSRKTDFLHVFGTVVNTVPLDDDIKVWTVKQIQEKMVQRGIGILKQLGQDVEGIIKTVINLSFRQIKMYYYK